MVHCELGVALRRPPWLGGGIERLVKEVSRRLSKRLDVSVFCTGDQPGVVMWQGIPVHVFRGYASQYCFSPTMYRALKRAKLGLVHAHCLTTFMPMAALLARKKYVFNPHFHHRGSTKYYEMLRKIYDPVLGPRLLRHANSVVCNSRSEMLLVQSACGTNPEKMMVIHNGVDLESIRRAERFEFEGNLFLCVSRLEKYKNVQAAIHAVKYLPDDYSLYVIGKGAYESALRELTTALHLDDRVKFLGHVPDEELYRWLKTCSLFVQFSQVESFGMTCLEALAAGKPVLVNNDGFGLKETADLFQGKGISLIEACSTPPKEVSRIMLDSTRTRVHVDLEDYDWENVANSFLEVYRGVLDGP